MGYNSLKVYPLQFPLLVPLDQAIGFNIAMKSSPCPCSGMDLSTVHSPSGVYLLQRGLIHGLQSLQGVYLLRPGLIHSHSCFEVYLLRHCLIHQPQSLQGCTCSSVALPMATESLQGCTCCVTATDASRCSGMALCTATDTSRSTCSGMDLSTTTDALRCTFSGMDLSTGHRRFDSSSHWSSSLSSTAVHED